MTKKHFKRTTIGSNANTDKY